MLLTVLINPATVAVAYGTCAVMDAQDFLTGFRVMLAALISGVGYAYTMRRAHKTGLRPATAWKRVVGPSRFVAVA